MADGGEFGGMIPRGGWRPAAKLGSAITAPSPFVGRSGGDRALADVADISAFEPDIRPPGGGVSLLELRPIYGDAPNQCRFPAAGATGEAIRFCGAVTEPGEVWCPRCAAYAIRSTAGGVHERGRPCARRGTET